jgi:hypothetical protein
MPPVMHCADRTTLWRALRLWAVQLNREYRRGLRTHPCGALVLRISGVEMLFPTFTTWGAARQEV